MPPWLLTTRPFNPNKIAPLYLRGSSFSLNSFKEKYENNIENLVNKFFVKDFFKLSVINFAVPSEVFKATIENETLNAIEVKVDITAEDSKKTAYVFLDRKYRLVCRLGKYELIGKPKDESVSNNSKLLSKFNLEIRNNDIKILAPGLENEAVNYYGSVSINGGTFKS